MADARFDHSGNPHKPGTLEWKRYEHRWREDRRFEEEITGRMGERTATMKAQARAHLAAVEEREAAGRRPLPAEWIEAMEEVEDQYPTRVRTMAEIIQAACANGATFKAPRGGIRYYPPPSLANASAAIHRAIPLCEHAQLPTTCETCRIERIQEAMRTLAAGLDLAAGVLADFGLAWGDPRPEPEVRTIRGKPAGKVKRCRPHGNPNGCAECSRARR